WLFNKYILACIAGLYGRDGVPVIGRCDNHCVDIVLFQQQPEVAELDRFIPSLLLDFGNCLGTMPAVNVTNSNYIDILVLKEASQTVHTHAAHTDEPQLDPVIGTHLKRGRP